MPTLQELNAACSGLTTALKSVKEKLLALRDCQNSTKLTLALTLTRTSESSYAVHGVAAINASYPIASVVWSGSDNVSASGQDVTLNFTSAGTKSVNVVVTDTQGNSKTGTGSIQLAEAVNPLNFAITLTASQPEGSDTQISAHVTGSSNKGVVNSFDWYVNGQQQANTSGSNVALNVPGPGIYTVKVVAHDSAGNTQEAQKQVTINSVSTPPASDPLVFTANVYVSDSSNGSNYSIYANAGGSSNKGTITTWHWYLNGVDQGVSNANGRTFTVPGPGNYTVRVVLSDSAGNSQDASATTTVASAQETINVSFAVTDNGINGSNGAQNFVLTPSASSTRSSITNYNWDVPSVGNFSRTSGEAINVSFTANGTYNVTLTVQSGTGATKSYTQAITVTQVNSSFTADFSYTRTESTDMSTGKTTEYYYFSALQGNSNSLIQSYVWAFPGGEPSSYNAGNPQNTTAASIWKANGSYEVSLTVTHTNGTSKTVKKIINVTTAGQSAPSSAPANVTRSNNDLTGYSTVRNLNDTNGGTYSDYQGVGGEGYLGKNAAGPITTRTDALPASYGSSTRYRISSITAYTTFKDQETGETSQSPYSVDVGSVTLYAGDGYGTGTTSGGRSYGTSTVVNPVSLSPNSFSIGDIGGRPYFFLGLDVAAFVRVTQITFTVVS